MTSREGTSLTAYVRAIERAWAAYVERPVLLSQRDWEQVCAWHARGIPLAIVRAAIDALGEGRRRRRKPRGLYTLAPAIEEEWVALKEGRSGGVADDRADAPTAPSPPGEASPADAADETPLDAWRRVVADDDTPPALTAVLERLIAARLSGEAAATVDAALDAALVEAVGAELADVAAREVDESLEPWRDRLPADAQDRARRRGVVERLRRRLRLPRLAAT